MSFDEFLARFRAKHPEWFVTGAAPAAIPKGSVQAVHTPAAPVAAVPVDLEDGWDGVEVEGGEEGEPERWWDK
jgi:hypothetical protein